MDDYDWEHIMSEIKGFARVENIQDIIILGDQVGKGVGVRRIHFTKDQEGDEK